MHGFEYFVPTEIVFGAGSTEKLPELLKKRGLSRVLVVYGGSSAKKSGLLDRVFRLLDEAGVQYRALGGVQPNPRAALAREGVQLALESGADDYITKPFGTSELLARIRTALRHVQLREGEQAQRQTGVFHTGDLEVDYDKRRVYVNGEDAHLTQNEYKIVALLSKYSGRVLTYDSIIKHIWGPNAKQGNQILRVNMANIRRKIEPSTAEPRYIMTEMGVGYRMAEGED